MACVLLFYAKSNGVCAKVEPVDIEHGDSWNFWAYSIKVCNNNDHTVRLIQKEYLQCDLYGRILESKKFSCGTSIGQHECHEFVEAPVCQEDAALSIFTLYWKDQDEQIVNLDIVIPRFGFEDDAVSSLLH